MSSRIAASRIMKLVAEVSSSISSAVAPDSRASARLAAWEVDPEAFAVEKAVVSVLEGRFVMKAEMSVPVTARPSSARTLTASGSVSTHSRPSPPTCGYTPRSIARSRVDLPW